jgi:NADH-quinone oxidoreductase subunit C
MASTKSYERKVDVTIPDVQLRLKEQLEQVLVGKFSLLESLRWDEYGLAIEVPKEGSFELFRTLKDGEPFRFNMLVDLTAVDWLGKREPRFDVVYQLMSLTYMHRLCLKVKVGGENPEVPSVRPLWDSAWFMEREVFDLFGIKFAGHGDLRRVIMYDEFVGHPLRKDYPVRAKQPRVQLRIPELRNTSADMHREQLVSLPSRRGAMPSQEPATEVPSE